MLVILTCFHLNHIIHIKEPKTLSGQQNNNKESCLKVNITLSTCASKRQRPTIQKQRHSIFNLSQLFTFKRTSNRSADHSSVISAMALDSSRWFKPTSPDTKETVRRICACRQ